MLVSVDQLQYGFIVDRTYLVCMDESMQGGGYLPDLANEIHSSLIQKILARTIQAQTSVIGMSGIGGKRTVRSGLEHQESGRSQTGARGRGPADCLHRI